jgi:[ribosomal protein S18]-alanine N-acetyltransferase
MRNATLADLPSIIAVERTAASAAHWSMPEYEKLVQSGLVLVAEDQGELEGFICAKVIAGEAEIENIVVAECSRRQGIADALLKELIGLARMQGWSVVFLEVRESNFPARALYEKHGFAETGRRRDYYRQPVEDAVLYELRAAT